MCDIVGYVGPRDASAILMAGLRKLEYRGYDSAGLAAVTDHRIEVRRCVGKLDNLAALLREQPLGGTPGIGHTRWATHGRPSEQNAHPHRAGKVVVIHNGIIENYLELRAALERRGRKMASETDTEVISHLIDEHVQRGCGLFEATRRAIQELEGSYSIVVLSETEPDRLVAAKSATPIVLGLGEGENFVASDVPALLEHTRRVVFLEDGEVAELTADRVKLQTFAGESVTRAPRTLLVVVSQSGEPADTLAAVEAGHEKGTPVLAVCNVVDSSIARRSSAVLYTHAGPEISVASTKAFTTQLTALYLLALHLGRQRGLVDAERGRKLLGDLVALPHAVKDILAREAAVERIARRYGKASDVLYLGRGVNYPVALEGALKLKEISYIHAEGYPAGEMKHGPIALINEQMPVVVLIPHDGVFQKTLSNLKEVESRGGRIIVVTDAPSPELEEVAADVLTVPRTNELLTPTLLTIPLQLLAYHVAVYRGTDVDQPRNLAKSVTVE